MKESFLYSNKLREIEVLIIELEHRKNSFNIENYNRFRSKEVQLLELEDINNSIEL